jgi:uncharacterized protein
MANGEILKIATYPLSGAAPVFHDAIEMGPAGLRGDREWLLVDEFGKRVSVKQQPNLGVVDVKEIPEGLLINIPGEGEHLVQNLDLNGRVSTVNEFGQQTQVNVGKELFMPMSRFLGQSVSIAKKTPEWMSGGVLPVSERKNRALHILGSASVEQECAIRNVSVEDRLNWRENLLVSTSVPFEENDWVKRIVEFQGNDNEQLTAAYVLKRTVRCKVPGFALDSNELNNDLPVSYDDLRSQQHDIENQTFLGVYAFPIIMGKISIGDTIYKSYWKLNLQ